MEESDRKEWLQLNKGLVRVYVTFFIASLSLIILSIISSEHKAQTFLVYPNPLPLSSFDKFEKSYEQNTESIPNPLPLADQQIKPSEPIDKSSLPRVEVVRHVKIPNPSFVEGLEFYNSTHVLMSSGLYGKSTLQMIELETQDVVQQYTLDGSYFGEGVTRLGPDQIYMLTYRSRKVFKLNDKFEVLETFELPQPIKEGWGMTNYKGKILVSDGTSNLYWINPHDFTIDKTWKQSARSKQSSLNELEIVNDKIFANQFGRSRILIFDIESGDLLDSLELPELLEYEKKYNKKFKINWTQMEKLNNVLNGIAFNKNTDTFYLTGKNWHFMTEVKINI